MAKQTIAIGTIAGDGTGDTLRNAFGKVNDNTDELYLQTGWISYEDTLHTLASPQTVAQGVTALLTNNGVTKIDSQKPTEVTDFFDVSTSKLTPKNENDFYAIDLMFKVKNTTASGVFSIYIDIPTLGQRFSQTKLCSKTANLEIGINVSFCHYTSIQFATNGGIIKVVAVEGDLSIYEKQFRICRMHRAR